MSAVTETTARGALDTVRRFRTTCKVRVDSHRFTQPLYLSDDVRSIQCAKSIKGGGQATVQLVAHRNWLNYLAPNDLINIYFNIGDGEGWTRTFFGFIDRIEESYSVDNKGAPTTTYSLQCSDFYKAFDRTQIYFNPQLAGREDLSGAFFGTPNIAGLALQTRGISAHGAPSDIVINFILLMLGFGTQFTLPESYNPLLASKLKQQRQEFITNGLKLSEFAREAINSAGFQNLLEQLKEEAELEATIALDSANAGTTAEGRMTLLAEQLGLTTQQVKAQGLDDNAALTEYFRQQALNREITLTNPNRAGDHDQGALNILNSTLTTAPPSLLDVVDPISFVERRAMDGYHAATPVWQRQGTLISILRSLSHEIMNELIFDLRPVTNSSEDEMDGNELLSINYSRGPDEILENIDLSVQEEQNGIQYIPAVVMREYPFSTIQGLKLDSADILGGRQAEVPIEGLSDSSNSANFYLYFGDIWQDRPNEPGRHVVTIPNINLADRQTARVKEPAYKHLDVAVISETEITSSRFGRSDNEHFNLMEFWVDGLLGSDQRFYMHDLLPILTPIHIMRHGLRTRTMTTRFARFSVDVADRAREEPSIAEEVEEVQESEEAAETPTEVTNRFTPHEVGQLTRLRESEKLTPYFPSRNRNAFPRTGAIIGVGYDVGPKRATTVLMDFNALGIFGSIVGFLTAAAGKRGPAAFDFVNNPPATFFPLPTITQAQLEDLFAFQQTRFLSFARARSTGNGANDNVNASEDVKISYDQFDALHAYIQEFLVELAWNTKVYSGPRVDQITSILRTDASEPVVMLQKFKRFVNSLSRSLQGPNGKDLRLEWLNAKIEELAEPEEEVAESTSPPATPVKRSSRGVVVDSQLVRKQVIRWALLNDLWYQHNLEYLSGSVDMRGAPEIRVGYRLDILERNMSFYVEAVNHSWAFPGRMQTALSVTRGQPNNPYPMYVLPPLNVFSSNESQRKLPTSRLAHYFLVPDPLAVRRGVVLRQSSGQNEAFQINPLELIATENGGNYVDNPEYAKTAYNEDVILPGDSSMPSEKKDVTAEFERQHIDRLDRVEFNETDNPSGIDGTNLDNQLPGVPRGGA